MNPEHFSFEFSIDDEDITVKWTLRDHVPRHEVSYRYPELVLKFEYKSISRDTVGVMLRDMKIPNTAYDAIMTRIAAPA